MQSLSKTRWKIEPRKPGSEKEEVIVLQSFFSTRKVERFIKEVNSIID